MLDPAVSCRRVWVLLTRLPPWARSGGQSWGAEADLLAALIDHVAYLTWVTLRAHGAKGATKPKPIRRPPAIRDELLRASPSRAAPRRWPARGGAEQLAEQGDAVKTASWTEAVKNLAAIPGIVVQEVGSGG